MKNALISASLLFALTGCATVAESARGHAVGLSQAEAREILTNFEKDLAKSDPTDPLRNPKSLDDVTEILKRDQIDLFPFGVEFASHQDSLEARALQAQIEIAWGEAQLILADLFADLAATKEVEVRRLASSGELPPKQAEELASLRKKVERQRNISDALTALAPEHVAAGATLTRKIIESAPNNYLGYRLAADYYRLRGDWDKYDEMVKKIEATNAGSNGLVFLKAMSAIQRHGRIGEGQGLLRQALEKDPKFVRAEAEMVLSHDGVDARYNELQVLKKLNPKHQVAVWVGPAIEIEWIKAQ